MSSQRYLIGLVSLGTLLEWAEYTFYGYMAITISGFFFPSNEPEVAILKTYGIFAAGFLMRPLGAIFFGHIGDNFGRKPALVGSLLLMGIATFSIGCLPTFANIGVSAPLLLLICRMLQGIAISGEYNGAGIFLIEKSADHYPCLASSWVSASAAAGMVMGGISALLVSHPLAPSWGWRLPFLLGGLSCLIGLWLRKDLPESMLFTKPRRAHFPLWEVFKYHKPAFLLVSAIAALTGIYVYIGNIYIVAFLKQFAELSTYQATFFAILGEIVVAITIPLMAYVADRTDAYRQYRLGLLLIAVASPLIFLLCYSGQYSNILLAMILYGTLNGVACGPMVKILCDQFPPSMRYSGISFAWSFAAALFGGTAPAVAQYLSVRCDWLLGPGFYVSAIALFTYLVSKLVSFTPSLEIALANRPINLKIDKQKC